MNERDITELRLFFLLFSTELQNSYLSNHQQRAHIKNSHLIKQHQQFGSFSAKNSNISRMLHS